MPNLDGTGPEGKGSATGRAMGNCGEKVKAKAQERGEEHCGGHGHGRGRHGRGCGGHGGWGHGRGQGRGQGWGRHHQEEWNDEEQEKSTEE